MNYRNRQQLYRKAFRETLEHYESVKEKSSIHAINVVGLSGVVNPAKPTNIDFICDVDNIIAEVIDKKDLTKFWNTYIIQDVTKPELTKSIRNYYELHLGRLFLSRSIWPVMKYFYVLRQKVK